MYYTNVAAFYWIDAYASIIVDQLPYLKETPKVNDQNAT